MVSMKVTKTRKFLIVGQVRSTKVWRLIWNDNFDRIPVISCTTTCSSYTTRFKASGSLHPLYVDRDWPSAIVCRRRSRCLPTARHGVHDHPRPVRVLRIGGQDGIIHAYINADQTQIHSPNPPDTRFFRDTPTIRETERGLYRFPANLA